MKPDLDRIAELVKQDLTEQCGDRYTFDPVIAERYTFYGYDEVDENCYAVWVGYAGLEKPPPYEIRYSLYHRLREELQEMGITHLRRFFVKAEKMETTRKRYRLAK